MSEVWLVPLEQKRQGRPCVTAHHVFFGKEWMQELAFGLLCADIPGPILLKGFCAGSHSWADAFASANGIHRYVARGPQES